MFNSTVSNIGKVVQWTPEAYQYGLNQTLINCKAQLANSPEYFQVSDWKTENLKPDHLSARLYLKDIK